MTHTGALFEVSDATFREIRDKLIAAGYAHAIDGDEIDMHGIVLLLQIDKINDDEMDL